MATAWISEDYLFLRDGKPEWNAKPIPTRELAELSEAFRQDCMREALLERMVPYIGEVWEE